MHRPQERLQTASIMTAMRSAASAGAPVVRAPSNRIKFDPASLSLLQELFDAGSDRRTASSGGGQTHVLANAESPLDQLCIVYTRLCTNDDGFAT